MRPPPTPRPVASSTTRSAPFEADRIVERPRRRSRFAGTKVLIVDDDFRNIFALTALLERGTPRSSSPRAAPRPRRSSTQAPDIDIVLMDIMMPGMDGYDTMRAIRAIDQFASLPIIAVTGKVVAASANAASTPEPTTTCPSPSNTAELLAALSPWLHNRRGSAR